MQPAASPKVVSVRRPACIQAYTRVSSPHDPAEKEAVATARKIIRMPVSDGAIHNENPPLFTRGGEGGWFSNEPPSLSGGQPLPLNIRRFMEPRFRTDFRNVKIHTGDKSAKLNRQLNAQAFTIGNHIFFGKESFQPESNEGKELIAHELTHTVQQEAVIQRAEDVSIIQQSPQMAQRLGISDALDYFADKANLIPGFRMFTIILGVNPVNMSRVDRSAANILRAVIEFIPGGGLITQALDNHGVFDKVGIWVEQQIHSLGMTGSVIKEAISTFLDSLGWRDIFDLGGVWNRAKRIFTGPIDRIISFVKGLVTGIIKFIKDAILRPLAKLAEGTRGYDLLKAVLGEDPVTGELVPRNAETLIGGFMKLIGQQEVWENLKKSNAVARAWAWFQGALSSLIGFVRQIPTMFLNAFKSLEIADIVLLPRAFAKVAAVFGNFIGSFLSWAGNAVWNLLEIIFAVVAPGVIPYLKKAAGAFRTILKNPIVFIGNLVRAGKSGFQQFANKIGTHLKTSLIQWLTGTLGGAGVYIPQSFDLREIIKFVLSILGLTWQNIRQKLVRVVGETVVKAMETGFDIVVTLVTQGPAAAWEKIKEQLTNLKEMVMEEIMSFVTNKIVQSAVTKLISMLTPAGAVIQAIIAIYNTIMFFIERLKQIAQVAAAFIDSISAIAGGVIAAAANRVEQTLAGLLTLAISFLARFAGLGKVSDAIINIINKLRAPIDKALDKVVEWIVGMAKKMGKFIAKTAGKVFNWASANSGFSDEEGKGHTIFVNDKAGPAKLMIASNPAPAEEFLNFYIKNRGDDFQKDNSKKIDQIKEIIKQTQSIVSQIDAATKKNPEDPKIEVMQRDLLKKNVELSGLLSSLVGRDASIGKTIEKYKIEGMTGTYSSMPKPPGDDFTADHQPQAAILQAAAEFDYFSDEGELAKRAAGRAKQGFAINLHKIRHTAGRTYGSKGKKTKESFLSEIRKETQGKKKVVEKRRLVVMKIKSELNEDVNAMQTVANSGPDSPNWSDIMSSKIAGKKEDKERLIKELRGRILTGESQIAAQDIESLVG